MLVNQNIIRELCNECVYKVDKISSEQTQLISVPFKLKKLSTIKLIACNDYNSFAVSEDNQIFIWSEENINSNRPDYMIIKCPYNISYILKCLGSLLYYSNGKV